MDDLDLDEISAVFLDECRENVDILEQGLLEMAQQGLDADKLNSVFRAAHSIKGGAATFGFTNLSELTHHMETLLDHIRSGNCDLRDEDTELLLRSIDVARNLMETGKNGDHPDRELLQSALAELADLAPTSESNTPDNRTVKKSISHWIVHFKPKQELMLRGNDPLLLARELGMLGSMEIILELEDLPTWKSLEPEKCYLSWQANLQGQVEKEEIAEIFEWISHDCALTIDLVQQAENTKTKKLAAEKATDSATTISDVTSNQKSNITSESTSIRIATEKIDQMINLVGELVITQSMLSRIGEKEGQADYDVLRIRLAELELNTRQLQESVMSVRMMPVSTGFGRLPRLVRDISSRLHKQVKLVVEGGDTEIDKTVLEHMIDPLVHLVRNALDHGLETPEERISAGKDQVGTLTLRAFHRGGSIVIEITDDGRGINRERILEIAAARGIVSPDATLTDEQIYQLIFAPGFSTAEELSDISGRGVGMDVVRKNITDLGGRIKLGSAPQKGTTVTIKLPLTLAILDGQLISVANQTFVIPLLSIVETIEIGSNLYKELPKSGGVFLFRGSYIPLIHLASRFLLPGNTCDAMVVIVEVHGHLLGIVIDQILGQQQVVIKALEDNYRSVPGITGATIMGDGSVALILDPTGLDNYDRLSEVA